MTETPIDQQVCTTDDTLPERADMPRIMDERTERNNVMHDDAIRYGRPCPVVGCTHPHTGAGPFVATSIARDGSQVTR